MADQLQELHDDLGSLTGGRPRMDRAVAYSNRAADAWREFTRRRYAGELLIDGRQAFTFSFVGQILLGTEAGAKGFEKLLTERGRRDLALPSSIDESRAPASSGCTRCPTTTTASTSSSWPAAAPWCSRRS